jgi:hypothetical protein
MDLRLYKQLNYAGMVVLAVLLLGTFYLASGNLGLSLLGAAVCLAIIVPLQFRQFQVMQDLLDYGGETIPIGLSPFWLVEPDDPPPGSGGSGAGPSRFCRSCGHTSSDPQARFCPACGGELELLNGTGVPTIFQRTAAR